MSVEANARLYIREVRDQFSMSDLRTWQEATVGTRRFFAFDHFGSTKTDEILSRVRYMVKALDCKWIFLDHLSILVSGLEGDDERRNIDNLMTKLRSIVEETNVAMLLVSHLRRAQGDNGHENGREVSLSHLRGSQSIAQLSDAVGEVIMKKIIHVNMHVIRKNQKKGERNPTITVKTYKTNTYAHEVDILGPSKVVYSPDKPLSCGARLWIETHSEVIADGQLI